MKADRAGGNIRQYENFTPVGVCWLGMRLIVARFANGNELLYCPDTGDVYTEYTDAETNR